MLSKIRLSVGLIILFLTLLCGPALWLRDYAVSQAPSPGDGAVSVYIPSGTPLCGIKNILVGRSLAKDDIRFEVLALVLGYADSLKAGHYSITAGATPLRILRRLKEGDVINYTLTIPEGYTLQQIGGVLEDRFAYNPEEFLTLCHDREFIRDLGFEVVNLEGYLFPDTYQLTVDMPLDSLIRKMVRRFQEIYDSLSAKKNSRITSSFSKHEIVAMASIVEKETALPSERPLVASVLINRLKRDMRLQIDPTVIYGLSRFGEVLSTNDLARDTPYNSYLHKGLPPGPICNPGSAALAAALKPAETSYLYFVSKDDGSHEFSRSLKGHINAVNRF